MPAKTALSPDEMKAFIARSLHLWSDGNLELLEELCTAELQSGPKFYEDWKTRGSTEVANKKQAVKPSELNRLETLYRFYGAKEPEL